MGVVPKDALVISQSGTSVVTLDGNKAKPVNVSVVAGHDNMMEVTGPLKAGTTIVTKGNERLWPGQAVQIKGKQKE